MIVTLSECVRSSLHRPGASIWRVVPDGKPAVLVSISRGQVRQDCSDENKLGLPADAWQAEKVLEFLAHLPAGYVACRKWAL